MENFPFNRLFLIAGPCVIESRRTTIQIAQRLAKLCRAQKIPLIFKASYDKANRSSHQSFRGPGSQLGLEILRAVKETTGLPILTDVHECHEVETAAQVVDILQIPAFLCRQTNLLAAAATSGCWVNVKKGPFLAPEDMKNVVNKLQAFGARHRILLTERGTCFGYQNLVVDFRSLPIMKRLGFPVIFDATHSVQRPGAGGHCSAGDVEFVPTLARAAIAAGYNGLFIETHPSPLRARSDGSNMVALRNLPSLLKQWLRIWHAT